MPVEEVAQFQGLCTLPSGRNGTFQMEEVAQFQVEEVAQFQVEDVAQFQVEEVAQFRTCHKLLEQPKWLRIGR